MNPLSVSIEASLDAPRHSATGDLLETALPQPSLSGLEAKAIVARRLAELGRDTNLVTGDAVTALRRYANSAEALRSVLTGALFLASTEESPYVDASHVMRAVAP